MTFEERRAARREARMMDKAGATADTTAAYYGASSRYVKAPESLDQELPRGKRNEFQPAKE